MSLPVEAIQRENSLSGWKVLNTASSRRISARAVRSIRAPGGPALHALETHRSSSEVPRTFSWCAECARGSPGRRIVRRVMHPGWRTCEWEDGKLRLGAEGTIEWAHGGERASGPGRAATDRTEAPGGAAGRLAGNTSALPTAAPASMRPRAGPGSSGRPERSPDRDLLYRQRGMSVRSGRGPPAARGFPSRTRGIQGHQGRSLRRSEITRYAIPPRTSAKTTRANHSR